MDGTADHGRRRWGVSLPRPWGLALVLAWGLAAPAQAGVTGYYDAARALLAGANPEQGLPLLAAATVAGPRTQEARRYLVGLLPQRCFDWDTAVFEAALPVLPNHPPLLECLGRHYEGKGRFAEAETLYLRWAALDAGLAEPAARLGELYDQWGMPERALAAFARYGALRGPGGYAERRMAAVAARWAEGLAPEPGDLDDAGPRNVERNRDAALRGDADAQYVLGLLLERGRTPDPTLAALWYGRAARQGHAEAAFRLARLLRRGRVAGGHPDGAAGWLAQAAAQGLPAAQFEMAVVCLGGEAGSPDLAGGVAWAERAAHGGLPHAGFLLATLQAYGIGMPGDRDRAEGWYRRADEGFSREGRPGPARLAREAARRLAPEVGGGAAPGDGRRPALTERGMP